MLIPIQEMEGLYLTARQKKFVDVYLRTGDGRAALKAARYTRGYTVKRALESTSIRAYLSSRSVVDEVEVAAFFSAVMQGKPAADEKLPGMKEQLKAAELLGRHFGMFDTRENAPSGETVEFVGDEVL